MLLCFFGKRIRRTLAVLYTGKTYHLEREKSGVVMENG